VPSRPISPADLSVFLPLRSFLPSSPYFKRYSPPPGEKCLFRGPRGEIRGLYADHVPRAEANLFLSAVTFDGLCQPRVAARRLCTRIHLSNSRIRRQSCPVSGEGRSIVGIRIFGSPCRPMRSRNAPFKPRTLVIAAIIAMYGLVIADADAFFVIQTEFEYAFRDFLKVIWLIIVEAFLQSN